MVLPGPSLMLLPPRVCLLALSMRQEDQLQKVSKHKGIQYSPPLIFSLRFILGRGCCMWMNCQWPVCLLGGLAASPVGLTGSMCPERVKEACVGALCYLQSHAPGSVSDTRQEEEYSPCAWPSLGSHRAWQLQPLSVPPATSTLPGLSTGTIPGNFGETASFSECLSSQFLEDVSPSLPHSLTAEGPIRKESI